MARYLGISEDNPSEDSERLVARALRMLPDDWTVVHHLSWQSKRGKRQGDGEADFVLIHPERGLVVVEVKGGGIDVRDGRWLSTNRGGVTNEIKNPYEQVVSSKYALIKWLEDHDLGKSISVGHAVAFPHIDDAPLIGPMAPPEITWTRTELGNPERMLDRVVKHWGLSANLSTEELKRLTRSLAPTVSVRRKLAAASRDADSEMIQMTAEQVATFSGLRAARGGLVLGGAGTGKTVLAIARAQQLARDGFRTLLVCFNELLGGQFKEQLVNQPGLVATHFHALCMSEIRRAKLPVPSTPSSEWWESDAAELLVSACAENGTEFQAVVIDEGQDFAPGWLEALRCITNTQSEAPFFVFADPRQELWGRSWDQFGKWDFTWELRQNMRNTNPIAQRVTAVFNTSTVQRGVDGPLPRWRDVHDTKRFESDVLSAVEALVEEGFGPTNLVVLCSSARSVARLREHTVGRYSLGAWGSKGIPVETVARFKGMESEAIVLALDRNDDSSNAAIGYVGMSRARTVLVVVGERRQQSIVNWTSN